MVTEVRIIQFRQSSGFAKFRHRYPVHIEPFMYVIHFLEHTICVKRVFETVFQTEPFAATDTETH